MYWKNFQKNTAWQLLFSSGYNKMYEVDEKHCSRMAN